MSKNKLNRRILLRLAAASSLVGASGITAGQESMETALDDKHDLPSDFAVSNLSNTPRRVTLSIVDPESDETLFSRAIQLSPVKQSNGSFHAFTPAVTAPKDGWYQLVASVDDQQVETSIFLHADGVPSFVTGSVYVKRDGSVSVSSAMA